MKPREREAMRRCAMTTVHNGHWSFDWREVGELHVVALG